MNRTDVIKLVKMLELNYSSNFRGKSKSDIEALINLYELQFRNYSAAEVNTAVMNIISNDPNPFAPTIATIKQNIKPKVMLIESKQSLMKKYDKDYDPKYDYRKDEMQNLILYKLHKSIGNELEECKKDFEVVCGISYDDWYNALQREIEEVQKWIIRFS